ncbi:MAG: IS630 family transposase, partial [Methanosarcinaceae archaeon]
DIECTDRRIADMELLAYEVAAWTRGRNDNENKINWEFTSKNADEKISKYYV